MNETSIRVGQIVPDFQLETYEPEQGEFGRIRLDDIKKAKKWLVLFFYPADFTFVCPTELEDLASIYAEMKSLGAEVVSVSTDTKFSHLAWRQSELLLKDVKYAMAADPTGRVSRLLGVYDEEGGEAMRGTFVISPEGRLVASEINYGNVGRNAEELLRRMKAIVYVADHPGEACPAKWEKGAKTLKPSSKIVGKVFEALK